MFQEFVLAKELMYLLGEELYSETFLTRSIIPASEWFLHIIDLGKQFSLGNMTINEMTMGILTGYQVRLTGR